MLNFLRRTTLANIVSALTVVTVTGYGIYAGNLDMLLIVLGAGIGYLYKTTNPTQVTSNETKTTNLP